MAGRFNGRVQREVLGITVASHRDLERLLAGFNAAYNIRRQRVLDGSSPEEVVRERLRGMRALSIPATAHRRTLAFCPRLRWSSNAPRTSHIQTASTTRPRSGRSGVPAARLLAEERDGRDTR
jgi:hypothetical protein